MRAYVLNDVGDFSLKNIETPRPKSGEVIVKVKAAGICGSDIPRAYVTGAHKHPIVLGHEFSGVVDSVGDGVDLKWVGKRVGVFPLIPCNKCTQCQEEHYEMCSDYSYLGSRTDGGFAHMVAVPQWNLIELPEEVSFESAAMLEPMAVAAHAIRRANLNSEDKVVVCGMGTIGLLVVMCLKEMGIRNIYAIYNKDIQKQCLMDIGLESTDCCDSRTGNVESWIMEKTNGQGVNAFFECVGKNDTVNYGLRSVAPSGKIMLVGNPHSDMCFDKNTYWKLLRRQITVFGTWNSSFTHNDLDDWNYVLKKLKDGRLRPEKFISHRYSFEDLLQGFEKMRDKEEYVKIIMCNDDNI